MQGQAQILSWKNGLLPVWHHTCEWYSVQQSDWEMLAMHKQAVLVLKLMAY